MTTDWQAESVDISNKIWARSCFGLILVTYPFKVMYMLRLPLFFGIAHRYTVNHTAALVK